MKRLLRVFLGAASTTAMILISVLTPVSASTAASVTLASYAGTLTTVDGSAGTISQCTSPLGSCNGFFTLNEGICSVSTSTLKAGNMTFHAGPFSFVDVPLTGTGNAGAGQLVAVVYNPAFDVAPITLTVNARGFCSGLAATDSLIDSAQGLDGLGKKYGVWQGNMYP